MAKLGAGKSAFRKLGDRCIRAARVADEHEEKGELEEALKLWKQIIVFINKFKTSDYYDDLPLGERRIVTKLRKLARKAKARTKKKIEVRDDAKEDMDEFIKWARRARAEAEQAAA